MASLKQQDITDRFKEKRVGYLAIKNQGVGTINVSIGSGSVMNFEPSNEPYILYAGGDYIDIDMTVKPEVDTDFNVVAIYSQKKC